MLKRIIFVILSLIFSYNAYAKDDCKLLVQVDNDLWIVDRDGRLYQRLTYDGMLKTAATWSPDGQYIAYSIGTPIGEEKAIIIVDMTGREVSKIIVDPKKSDDPIRFIDRIVWEKPTILWLSLSVGPHGGYIDILKLDPSLRYLHKKRIGTLGWGCELSPNQQHIACVQEIFENGKSVSFLRIYETSKKEFPEDAFFFDSDPLTIELRQIKRVDKISFTPDGTRAVIISGDRKYELNTLDNKLSEIKELPQGVKIKRLPEAVKIKRDAELYHAEVFDMYCN